MHRMSTNELFSMKVMAVIEFCMTFDSDLCLLNFFVVALPQAFTARRFMIMENSDDGEGWSLADSAVIS